MAEPSGKTRPVVYFEFTRYGTTVKVAAIDSVSGLEVAIVGPATATRAELEQLALEKLEFVRKRKDTEVGKRGGPGVIA